MAKKSEYRCRCCWLIKDREEFYQRSNGYHMQPCKECYKGLQREYSKQRGTQIRRERDGHRLRRYGVTLKQAQNGQKLCHICNNREANCVDHNHDTGEVRGALCRTCNMALHYMENKQWAKKAIKYLGGGLPWLEDAKGDTLDLSLKSSGE